MYMFESVSIHQTNRQKLTYYLHLYGRNVCSFKHFTPLHPFLISGSPPWFLSYIWTLVSGHKLGAEISSMGTEQALFFSIVLHDKCDLFAQNQSQVFKHKIAENCILCKNFKKIIFGGKTLSTTTFKIFVLHYSARFFLSICSFFESC